jgi:uncharacterized protein
MDSQENQYTLITGASSGLGKALALECARQNRHLLLVALPGSNLTAFATQLSEQYSTIVHPFEVDLTDQRQLNAFSRRINRQYHVNFLINNAGVGGTRGILAADPDYLNRIIDVNIRAPTLLTRFLLPNLIEQKEAYILNIASLAALSPTPFKTIYPASKTFVQYFSLALGAELKGTGVHVSVAFPGGILSNFDSSYRILRHGWFVGKSIVSISDLAFLLVSQTLRRRKVIYPGLINRISSFLLSFLAPEKRVILSSGLVQKELKLSVPS